MTLADSNSRRGGIPPKQKTQVMPTLSAQAISRDGERMEHMIACCIMVRVVRGWGDTGKKWVQPLLIFQHIDIPIPFYIDVMRWVPYLEVAHLHAARVRAKDDKEKVDDELDGVEGEVPRACVEAEEVRQHACFVCSGG